jgi:hypothetical protein
MDIKQARALRRSRIRRQPRLVEVRLIDVFESLLIGSVKFRMSKGEPRDKAGLKAMHALVNEAMQAYAILGAAAISDLEEISDDQLYESLKVLVDSALESMKESIGVVREDAVRHIELRRSRR